ncbi:MAG TPA: DUF1844 domain-containing protein [Candidatus Saccharimonadales bacterium]|jgi:hypothetical protein|nr:DUF1844 domain-containing protein [Candidatus Saccharimonadales bacterium]
MTEKKQEFVVSDRRRFAPEGDLRPDAERPEEESAPAAPAILGSAAPAPAAAPAQIAPQPGAPAEAESEEMPEPPTAQEQHDLNEAYRSSTAKLDSMVGAPVRSPETEMNFERLIEFFYTSALIQMGAIRPEGATGGIDIAGARQVIDTLAVLQEKTKGNLSERESIMLQNVIFELRMAWIEITNAIAKAPLPKPGGPAPVPGGGIFK